jgi:ABC-2 type transport system permease protein
VIGVAALIVLPATLGDEGPRVFRVGVVDGGPTALRPPITSAAASMGGRASLRRYDSVSQVRADLLAERLEVAVADASILIRGDGTDDEARGFADLLAHALAVQTGLAQTGIAPNEIPDLVSPRPLPVQSVVPVSPDESANQQAVFIGVLILYISLITYGTWVGTGVLEEKGSRVVEILISTIRPYQLLAGKVLGIGLLGLAQLTAVAVAGVVSAAAVGNIPTAAPDAIGLTLLFFVLGFAFYSLMFAAVGAAASRPEDAQNSLGPVTLVIVVAYFLSLGAMSDPDGTVARLAPFVPPLAPMVMPARLTLGHAGWWELPVSVVILAAATYGLVRVGGRAYVGGLLRFGGTKLRDAYRSATTADSRSPAN